MTRRPASFLGYDSTNDAPVPSDDVDSGGRSADENHTS